jgi:inhibitor of cysteine peptidase
MLLCFGILTAGAIVPCQLNVGAILTLNLESNPTTGYSWQLAKPLDNRLVKLLGHRYCPQKAAPGVVGSGGIEIWRFKALRAGQTQINLKYCRPWEKGIAPAKTKKIDILIK